MCVVHRFAMGYWKNPEATEATFGGGRLKTGDIGVINEGGFVWIVDRKVSPFHILKRRLDIVALTLVRNLSKSTHCEFLLLSLK